MKIEKQRATSDCFLCCIAMFADKDYEEIFNEKLRQEIENEKGAYGEIIDNLCFVCAGMEKYIDYECVYTLNTKPADVRSLLWGRRAILQVPSLNNEDSDHCVYWTGKELIDPSNKQVYRWLNQCFPIYVWIRNENL